MSNGNGLPIGYRAMSGIRVRPGRDHRQFVEVVLWINRTGHSGGIYRVVRAVELGVPAISAVVEKGLFDSKITLLISRPYRIVDSVGPLDPLVALYRRLSTSEGSVSEAQMDGTYVRVHQY